MERSYRVSKEGLEKAKKAFKLTGWTQDYLAGRVDCTRQTVIKFFARRCVEKNIFQHICTEINLEWGEVAELEPEEAQYSRPFSIGNLAQTAQEKTCEISQESCSNTQVLTTPADVTTGQKATDEKRYAYAIAGSVDEVDILKLKAIAALLKELAKDTSIKIVDIEQGSIKLILEGSQKGLERLEALFKAGKLTEVSGIPVGDVEFVATRTSDNDRDTITDKKLLAFTIASNVSKADIAKLKIALTETSNDENKTESDNKSSLVQENSTDEGAISRSRSSGNLSEAELGSRSSLPTINTLRVLVVDEHELTRLTLKLAFSCQENIQVVGLASNGQEAIEMVKRYQPDVIVLDLQMPVMDGWSASEHIKLIAPNTQIIAYGLVEDTNVQELRKMGSMDAFCGKDVPTDELIALTRQLGQRALTNNIF